MASKLALGNPHLDAKIKACLDVGYDFRPFMNTQAGGIRTTAITTARRAKDVSAAKRPLKRCKG